MSKIVSVKSRNLHFIIQAHLAQSHKYQRPIVLSAPTLSSTLILLEDCFSDIRYVLATQVKDQKTQRQLTAAGFLVITQ